MADCTRYKTELNPDTTCKGIPNKTRIPGIKDEVPCLEFT